jgi:hypothetical protein
MVSGVLSTDSDDDDGVSSTDSDDGADGGMICQPASPVFVPSL